MWTFIGFTLSMLIGSYFAGSIPLAFNFSDSKLKQVSVFGAGLLVGTALTVIIPEGVHAMYSEHLHAAVHQSVPGLHSGGVGGPAGSPSEHAHHERPPIHPHHSAGAGGAAIAPVGPGAASMRKIAGLSSPGKAPLTSGEMVAHVVGPGTAADTPKGHNSLEEVHQVIGVVLLLGFLFMLLIDQVMGRSRGFDKKMTATMGLVVHAAADGVALGAASSTAHLHVEFIVFLAIMLHKGPAAFGLVSFLLRDGVDRNRIRRHLLVFSLAAPLLAAFTYFGLSQRSKEHLDTMNGTALAMLFSAGTFLYVATVHVLPELEAKNGSCSSPSASAGPGLTVGGCEERNGFSRVDLFLIVLGCCLPLVLSVGHSHH